MSPRDTPPPPDPLLAAVLNLDPAVRDHPAVAGCLDLWRAGEATLPDALLRAVTELVHVNHLRGLIIARATAAGAAPPAPGARGIVCPDCAAPLRVRRTTPAPGRIVRARCCPRCGFATPTTERPGR